MGRSSLCKIIRKEDKINGQGVVPLGRTVLRFLSVFLFFREEEDRVLKAFER